jgi:hypothetical protein
MNASNRDVGLTIIAGGRESFYSTVRAASGLIWDCRLGIFSPHPPEAWNALSFIKGTDWEDATLHLDKPPESTVYGSIIIDFDRKMVTDDNRWMRSDEVFYDWLDRSVRQSIAGLNGLVPGTSLLEHFRRGRIQLVAGQQVYGQALRCDSLIRARDAMTSTQQAAAASGRLVGFARINLPADWRIVRSAERAQGGSPSDLARFEHAA